MSKRRVGGTIKAKKAANEKIEKGDEVEENGEDQNKQKKSVKIFQKKKLEIGAAKQADILLQIENENTTKHIKELCDKFEPPVCKRCPNRNADKVCVCNQCDHQDYFSLICGKCHLDKHSASKEKPEIDIQELFIKLGTCINEAKINPSFISQGINIEQLQNSFGKISELEVLLTEIEEDFKREISTYKSPEEIENSLSSNVAKCLSDPSFGNFQEQLYEIKGAIIFENNDFKWNGIQEKRKSLRNQVKSIKNETNLVRRLVFESFVGQDCFDLSALEVKQAMHQNKNSKIGVSKDNKITIQTLANSHEQQFYLDLEIDSAKKYTMRFTIQSFSNNYFFIGLMKKEQINSQYLYSGSCGQFFKRFYNSCPSQDCSKVIKGTLFGDSVKSGNSYEMRFCIKDQILEFLTLPDHENIVSKLDNSHFEVNSQYVITFSPYHNIEISIDSLEENPIFFEY